MDNKQNKASVLIQARMCSTRLHGKVMMKVLGKPLIGHMIDRLRHANMVDRIIVTTPVNDANNRMCDYLKRLGIIVFRGNEEDVLERFYETAKKYNLKHIVRLTADCPLIDPGVVDQFIMEYFACGADYVCGTPRLAEGLDTEVFSFSVLERVYRQARKKSEREHVTLYIHNNPTLFKLVKIENETDDSKYRLTVDEQEDFEVVKRIFDALYVNPSVVFNINAIKKFLDQHPEIHSLNGSIIRNEGLLKSLAVSLRSQFGLG